MHKDASLCMLNKFVTCRQIIMHNFEVVKICIIMRTYAYAQACINMQAVSLCKNTHMLGKVSQSTS